METFSLILAQAATPATEAAPQGGGSSMILFLVLMFAAMYFLMIAPQRKRQKAHAKMISELKSGDEVVTIGGACGVVHSVKEKTIVIKFGDTKIEFLKAAVQEKTNTTSSEAK